MNHWKRNTYHNFFSIVFREVGLKNNTLAYQQILLCIVEIMFPFNLNQIVSQFRSYWFYFATLSNFVCTLKVSSRHANLDLAKLILPFWVSEQLLMWNYLVRINTIFRHNYDHSNQFVFLYHRKYLTKLIRCTLDSR